MYSDHENMYIKFQPENLKETDIFEELSINGRIIL